MFSVFIGIDVGKTSLRVGVFSHELDRLHRWSMPSDNPTAALEQMIAHLKELDSTFQILAVGISTFGPLDCDPGSIAFGSIQTSSDVLWTGINLPRQVEETLHKSVYFDYDVNAGALAEKTIGSGMGLDRFIYLSIGTGIGAASVPSGLPPGHSAQFGHMYLPKEPDDLDFQGSCRFHGACFQGLASGRALSERWGVVSEKLTANHPAWNLEARYIARAATNLVYSFLPDQILLGSSIALVPDLADRANQYLSNFLNGFLDSSTALSYCIKQPIVKAQLAPDSSFIGAALMAKNAVGIRYA